MCNEAVFCAATHLCCCRLPHPPLPLPIAAGYQVLSVDVVGTLKNTTCNSQFSYAKPPLMSQCTLTTPGGTYLSVYVDQYCGGEQAFSRGACCSSAGRGARRRSLLASVPGTPPAVTVSPIKDTACAQPAASYWPTVLIRGHYITPSLISTRLDTTRCGAWEGRRNCPGDGLCCALT